MKFENIEMYMDGGSIAFSYNGIDYHIDRGIGSRTKYQLFFGEINNRLGVVPNQLDVLNEMCFNLKKQTNKTMETNDNTFDYGYNLLNLIEISIEKQNNI